MNLRVFLAAFLLCIACVLAGCDRTTKDKDKKNPDGSTDIHVEVKQASPFKAAEEMFKYPNNPRSNDDWTRFRDGLQLLSEHFDKSEVLARLRLSEKDRDFLTKEVHLSKSELAEVESTAFRSADAYYMDECYLLRDVAHHLEVAGVSPLEQARLDFAWVMRNVMLHESSDTWLPPAFTVRRGYGNAVARSLVFLALLRQAQVDGCLIVVPNTEPLQFLVAVHDAKSASLRLFDPRLERPIVGKDGKSIATLQEALETPALLSPSMITAEQAKKLEAWMVCPLYALSPRMLELQKGLRAQESIVLYLSAEKARGQLAKATTLPIKVWNPADDAPATAKGPSLPANSPTRALRLFLPKSDGGLDETNRLAFYNRARIPEQMVLNNYAQIKLTPQLLPRPIFQLLVSLSLDLLGKYDIQTRELYLRGKYEPMIRRQDRIQDFVSNNAFANLAEDPKFNKERAEWQDNVTKAFANAAEANDDPNARKNLAHLMQMQVAQDQFVLFLLETEKEELLDRGFKEEKRERGLRKTVLAKILAVGLHDILQSELARSRAGTFHEIAADRQASLEAMANPSKGFQTRVNKSWFDAKSAWGNSYLDRIALAQTIEQRLNQMNQRVHPQDVDTRISMLEFLHLDAQKYFQARMRFAEALVHTDGAKASLASFAKTKAEIEGMEKSGQLQAEIKKMREAVAQPGLAFFQKRLDLLENDWTERGSYFWLKREIDLRLGK